LSIKSSNLKKALTKKGFVKKDSTNHDKYVFYYNDAKTDIWTIMSRGGHGEKDLGETLMSNVKKQMCFENKDQLIRFSECTFTEKDYIEMLIKNGDLEETQDSE